ncbi:hypothetical protein [Williamsia sp. CHRR-6]|uniref:hypothetical protein n=1 Tax=Williamsia sp. CHRR-6 TaxID=2835871 RepID=UPI001BD9CECF|nr:hypothetical protein [Williamsia sp. CHRR-6]MBT0567475.1 hypothetical protein [Williamsia sp. CHRR-6]
MVLLDVTVPDKSAGSRLGGAPPKWFDGNDVLDSHHYLLTLESGLTEWQCGREASVFVRRDFEFGASDAALEYPDIPIRTVLHPPSPRSSRSRGRHPGLASMALTVRDREDAQAPFLRVGEPRVLIQNEPSYASAVEADGHRFLFQLDEDGWPVPPSPAGEVVDQYLFGYGSVYFYGSPGPRGCIDDVVVGFFDF